MLNGAGERKRRENRVTKPVQIGLVGPRGAGASGLVWSLMVNSGRRLPSLFGEDWRFDHVVPARTMDDDLLSYLDPHRPLQGLDGPSLVAQPPRETGATISTFRLSSAPRSDGEMRHRAVLEIFDTSTARQLGLGAGDEPGWARYAKQAAPHIVLCHAIDSVADRSWYEEFFEQLLQRCHGVKRRGTAPLRSLMVAFTRYDLAFLANPKGAPRRPGDRTEAQRRLRAELEHAAVLRNGLRELGKAGVRISAIPVSTFGFTRGDGRPNFDGWLDIPERGKTAAMLTRPDIYYRALAAMHRDGSGASDPLAADESSGDELDWLRSHWRPFMTADAFVACVSKDSHDLIFSLSDLLDEIRERRAAYS